MQPSKAPPSIFVTLLEIVNEVKAVQSVKAHHPMLVTLFGKLTDVKLVQYAKALSPMLVTPSSITTDFMEEQLEYHGISGNVVQSAMAPVPEMVRVPPLNVHVRLSPSLPHVPLLWANTVPALAASARRNVKIFFIHFNFGLIMLFYIRFFCNHAELSALHGLTI